MQNLTTFDTISALVADLKRGRPVIIVDDEHRENEGDLVFLASSATEELLAFVIRYTGGVVCLALSDAVADRLELSPMVPSNSSLRGTAFTVSIDAQCGITTGISAADRAHTLKMAAAPSSSSQDFARPGHIFPLRANAGGLASRAGHTEGAVELCRRCGAIEAAAVSELMHDDGTMMRLPAILDFAATHRLLVGSIACLQDPEERI